VTIHNKFTEMACRWKRLCQEETSGIRKARNTRELSDRRGDDLSGSDVVFVRGLRDSVDNALCKRILWGIVTVSRNGATNRTNRKHLSRRSRRVGHAFCSRVSQKSRNSLENDGGRARELFHQARNRRFSTCSHNSPCDLSREMYAVAKTIRDDVSFAWKKKINPESIPKIAILHIQRVSVIF